MRFFSGPELPQNDSGWVFIPDPTKGAYNAPQTLSSVIWKGPRKRNGEEEKT